MTQADWKGEVDRLLVELISYYVENRISTRAVRIKKAQTVAAIQALTLGIVPEKKPNNDTSGVFNSNGIELGVAGYNTAIDTMIERLK